MTDALLAFCYREALRFVRQKGRLIATIITPVSLWLVLGFGFGSLFEQTYLQTKSLEFFFPGKLLMTLLFASIFSMISVIEDRNEGFMQGVLLVHHAHHKIVWGKVVATVVWSMLQVYIVLLLAPLIGFSITLSMFVQISILLILASVLLSLISFFFAWYLNSIQGFHSVMNVVLLPMWVLSGALFPMESAHPVMRFFMQLNPLSYILDMLNKVLYLQYSMGAFLTDQSFWILFLAMGLLIAFMFKLCLALVKPH